jgi:hypothetical protein
VAALEGHATLTERDYEEAWQALSRFRRSPSVWWSIQASGLVGVTALAASIFTGDLLFFALALVPILVVLLGPAYLTRLARGRWARRALEGNGREPQTFRFDEEGVTFASGVERQGLSWAELRQHLELPSNFMIFESRKAFLVVPKRAFGADDVEALREMLRERLPTRPDQAPAFASRPANRRTYLLWAFLLAAFLGIWHVSSMDSSP